MFRRRTQIALRLNGAWRALLAWASVGEGVRRSLMPLSALLYNHLLRRRPSDRIRVFFLKQGRS